MRHFPMFVSLEGKKVYIAGAGAVALRRILTLLEFGADITVCAPEARGEIRELSKQRRITYLSEKYQEEHLKGISFVLAATDSREVNHAVWLACKKNGIPVNTADCREECDFYFPAVAFADDIVVGITGDGTDHAKVRDTAAEIRNYLRRQKRIKIYMIRHFATSGNLKKRYIGRTDEPILKPDSDIVPTVITGNGTIAESDFLPPVEYLYVSPLRRCRESASILYPGMEQRIVEDFRECDFGEFENKNYRELAGNISYQRWIDSGGTECFPGGENPAEFKERSREAFERCVEELIDLEACTAAMVVHGGTIMAVLEAYGRPERTYYEWHVDNGCGFCVYVDPDVWKNKKKELYPEYRIERNDR